VSLSWSDVTTVLADVCSRMEAELEASKKEPISSDDLQEVLAWREGYSRAILDIRSRTHAALVDLVLERQQA
jgi:hypothetical protein